MARKVIFLKDTRSSGTSSWTVPDDFSSVNSIHCIAGGGSGGNGGSDGAAGGGGGAYSRKNNVSLTPGATVRYRVGEGGIAEEGDGGDTWFGSFSYGSALCAAKAGLNPPGTGSGNKSGGEGGSGADGIGDVRYSGGQGRDATSGNAGGGGGGAAGPTGNGSGGGTTRNGGDAAGGSGTGGVEGDPDAAMVEVWTQTSNGEKAGPGGGGYSAYPGAKYGGGGGGEDNWGGGANGGQGLIVIEYEVISPSITIGIVG